MLAGILMCGCGGAENGFVVSGDAGGGATDSSCPLSATSGIRESNHNYTLNSSCNPLQGVSVTISVTQDLVTTNGFSLQLNADGMNTSRVAWQQYVLGVDPSGNLYGVVDNWDNKNNQIFNNWQQLFSMPKRADGTPYVPTGYEFTISISTDVNANVTGASYYVVDGSGNVLSNYSLLLNTLGEYDGGGYSPTDIGPIGDITLNVVGFDSSQGTTFTSGAGNIIYHSGSPLTVIGSPASCTYNFWTAENSNSLYGDLPTFMPSGDYVQNFTSCQ
jgi:hypothetical protein